MEIGHDHTRFARLYRYSLTGIGTAYFDDVRIEPLHPAGGGPTAQRPLRTTASK